MMWHPWTQALGQHAPLMPDTRRVELMNLIKLYLGRDPSQEPTCLQPGDLVAARVAGVSPKVAQTRSHHSRYCLPFRKGK